MCAFPPETCSLRLWFHDCMERARPETQNVRCHHAERPKPILTPWNPTGKPILCDCMIIGVGLAGCLCKRGLFIHSGFRSCAKAPSDLNGSIIRRLKPLSDFKRKKPPAWPSGPESRKNQWIVIKKFWKNKDCYCVAEYDWEAPEYVLFICTVKNAAFPLTCEQSSQHVLQD